MKYFPGKTIVVALGGSIIYPDNIDYKFLKNFKKFLTPWIKKGKRFVIVTGGGRLSRTYQFAAEKIGRITNEDKDWLGIHATRSNAHLLRTVFRGVADPIVIDARHRIKKLKHPITIASGWRPGWSTDYVAVALAVDFGVKDIIVAGRPSYVYDKDHAIHKNAKPLRELSWEHYKKIIPRKWTPGAHTPVDPVAARLADKERLRVVVINGSNLENFSKLLSGKEFRGTMIV